jgi:flagellin
MRFETVYSRRLSNARASYGAIQNRLEYTVSNLMNVAEFTTAARSSIEDADFAAESARLAKAQVLQQTGTAMLAQANSSSQLVMSLIR